MARIHTSGGKIGIYTFIGCCWILLSAASMAQEWKTPQSEKEKENPIAVGEESISHGKQLYAQLCAFCHGEKGEGLNREVTGLQKDTPGLADGIDLHSDGDFHWKIRQGKGEMHSFKRELADNEIWDILNYLKSFER